MKKLILQFSFALLILTSFSANADSKSLSETSILNKVVIDSPDEPEVIQIMYVGRYVYIIFSDGTIIRVPH